MKIRQELVVTDETECEHITRAIYYCALEPYASDSLIQCSENVIF